MERTRDIFCGSLTIMRNTTQVRRHTIINVDSLRLSVIIDQGSISRSVYGLFLFIRQ